jgi:hypothetical protein
MEISTELLERLAFRPHGGYLRYAGLARSE